MFRRRKYLIFIHFFIICFGSSAALADVAANSTTGAPTLKAPIVATTPTLPVTAGDTTDFGVSASTFLASQQPLVTVAAVVQVGDQDFKAVREQIMQKLTLLSTAAGSTAPVAATPVAVTISDPRLGMWNITKFMEQQSKEMNVIYLEVQGRVAANDLDNLRSRIGSLNKPNLTLRIAGIDYFPSDSELNGAKLALKANLYTQALQKLAVLNKDSVPTGKKYKVSSVDMQSATRSCQSPENRFVMTREVAQGAALMKLTNPEGMSYREVADTILANWQKQHPETRADRQLQCDPTAQPVAGQQGTGAIITVSARVQLDAQYTGD